MLIGLLKCHNINYKVLFFIVLSLTKYLQREYESVYTIIGIMGSLNQSIIIFKVVPIAITILTPLTIPYISDAKTLQVMYLLLVKLQWIRLLQIIKLFSLVNLFVIIISYPSQELKSLLFINNPLINIKSLAVGRLINIQSNPQLKWFIC